MTQVTRTPIESSNLVSIGYDESTSTLAIEFHGGKVWEYSPVPKDVYDRMLGAREQGGSAGSIFHHEVKRNPDVVATKVDDPCG